MKLFLTATALLAPMGHAQTSPSAASLEPGQHECKGDLYIPGGVCEYFQDCIEPANKSFTQCIPKGNTACYLYKELGDSGDIREVKTPVVNKGCAPYETCCDGDCCPSSHHCVDVVGGTHSFMYGDETITDVNNVVRNSWKTAKGIEVKNYPRKCVPKLDSPVMDTSTAMKAIYMPMLGVGLCVLFFAVAIAKRQKAIAAMLAELALIGTSCFLVVSEGWIMSLLCVFLAAASAASGDQDKKWLVWFQIFFMWMYFGGSSGLMFSSAPTNFFTEATKSSATVKTLCESCSDYFDYYKLQGNQLDYRFDSGTTDIYTGICGAGFIGYQIFVAYLQAASLFLMNTITVVNYLNPSVKATETANPSVEMGA